MRSIRWIVLSIVFALAPMVAGASVSYTWNSALDDWGPWGSATDCVWVSGSGHNAAGAMRAGLSCLSPQFTKESGYSVESHFWIASNSAGGSGRWAVVLDPFSETVYCSETLMSSTSDPAVWDQQMLSCEDSAVVSATAFHLLIDYNLAGALYVDDLSVNGDPVVIPTSTPAPILATATPTTAPIIFPATPTAIPTWLPAATPTAIPQPTIVAGPTVAPGGPGDLYFPVSGGGLLGYASGFLGDWSAIIGPAAIAALSAGVLVLLGKFLGGR